MVWKLTGLRSRHHGEESCGTEGGEVGLEEIGGRGEVIHWKCHSFAMWGEQYNSLNTYT